MKKIQLLTLIISTITIASASAYHAFIWDSTNGMRDLGTLGGDSFATAINDSGQVTGYSFVPGQLYPHAFLWSESTGMVDLGIPGRGHSPKATSHGLAINSSGNIAGYGRDGDGVQVAFFWSPGTGFVRLGDLDCNCDNANVAYAINDQNQVTGNLRVDGSGIPYHAFLWSPDQSRPRDLGTVDGARWSIGYAINNLGRIIGASLEQTSWLPMVWTRKAGMNLLGPIPDALYTNPTAINDAGEIVGYAITSTSTEAFYQGPNAPLTFLHGLGGNETWAHAINQLGVIAGQSEITEGTVHAVIWATALSAPQDIGDGAARGINNVGQVVGETGVFQSQSDHH